MPAGDPLTNTTAFYYDLNGRMTNVVYPGGLSVTNHYNLFGHLIRVADSTGNNITNWYNNQGLIVAVSNAFGRVQSAVYDIEDHPTSSTDANGVTIETTYRKGVGPVYCTLFTFLEVAFAIGAPHWPSIATRRPQGEC